MGVPSITILLHEILKLLHYAEAVDPVIIRIGTSAGLGFITRAYTGTFIALFIGLPAGTLVITDRAVNDYVEEEHEMVRVICWQLVD